ncbi:LysR substrate-binding domain-containing protein [Kiloniella sp.]|uniref:LysR substrate-binding domain-containing protein n=1 Tax=Kiloniella sp. TaxID=1938587 RepID=UPI003B02C6F6
MKIDVSSLNMLRAFEVAARKLSFTLAASELNVNQPAVSRQIAALEMQLGTTLFLRTRPRLSLTSDGQALYTAVTNGFSEISVALAAIQNRNSSNTVSVRTSIGFASCFLINRLSEFNDLHPDVELELVTSDRFHEYDPTDFDVAVIFGHQDELSNYETHLIFPEVLVPVCAPNYFTSEQKQRQVNLSDEKLLTFAESAHLNNWKTYFSGTKETPKEPEKSNVYNSFMVYFHAVLNGKGVALAWAGLIEEFINNGRLIPIGDRRVRTERGYYCCLSDRGKKNISAKKFASWLRNETKPARQEMMTKEVLKT